MKYLLKITLTTMCCFLLFACGDESKKTQNELKQAIETISDAPKKAKKIKTIYEEVELLRTKTPLNEEQFTKWAPEEIGNFKRTSLITNLMREMNLGSCSAYYKDNTTKQELEFTVIDGAGKMGASAISPFLSSEIASVNNETERGYQKSVEKNGIKAIETYRKSADNYEIIFLYGKRFGVSVETEGISNVSDVWAIIAKLNLDDLTRMAN